MRGKHPTSIRLSERAKRLLALLAADDLRSQSATLEILLRDEARRRQLDERVLDEQVGAR